jgi:plastocyanin
VRTCSAAFAVAVLSLGVWGCTNSGPSTPSPASGTVTIDVVAVNGSQSFSPNPASIPAGQMVIWHNVDTITHRVVLNDLSIDTGNLDPGAFSSPMVLETPITAGSIP